MSCVVGWRWDSDPVLLWLGYRSAGVAPFWLLAWELPYATGVALKRKKKKGSTRTEKVSMFFIHERSKVWSVSAPGALGPKQGGFDNKDKLLSRERDGEERGADREKLGEFTSLVSVLLGTHLHPCCPLPVFEEEKHTPWHSAAGLAVLARIPSSTEQKGSCGI